MAILSGDLLLHGQLCSRSVNRGTLFLIRRVERKCWPEVKRMLLASGAGVISNLRDKRGSGAHRY